MNPVCASMSTAAPRGVSPSERTIASSRERSSSHARRALMSPIAATPAVSQYSTRVMTNVRSKMRIESRADSR